MAPRNVLLMVADDLGKQLGCYGATKIKTPHLDQLATEGTRFDKAFASTASCSGSRSVIYTGLHTHQNGQYGLANNRQHFTTFDHVDSAPRIFARHGYLTGIIGKVHVGPASVYPWDVREENDSREVSVVADRATAFFQKSKSSNKPFFLTIGFIDPHRDLTRSGFGNNAGAYASGRLQEVTYSPDDVEIPPFINDTPGARLELAEYYQSISRMDQGVGLILAGLKSAGLAEDTLVVFLSDNGPPFINSKTTLYDAGVNLPLIVRKPGSPGGIASPNLVSYVDILPTLLEWAQYPQFEQGKGGAKGPRPGRSFLSILSESHELSEWDHVFGSHTFHEITNYWPTRYLRNRRYKYHRNIAWRLDFPFAADIYGSLSWEDIRKAEIDQHTGSQMIGKRPLPNYFFRPAEELYDLVEDPYEVHNLAKDPAYESVRKDMQQSLEDWQRRTEDAWLYRDGVSVLLNRHHVHAGLKLPDRWDFDPQRAAGDEVDAYSL